MATKGARQIFVNLPTRNLEKTMSFFRELGFDFNMQFTNEEAACMVVNDEAFVMLLQHPFFETFTKKKICDTDTHVEALMGISCESREAVDEMVEKAVAAGGSHAMDPQDHGFMYGWSFHDLDGHHWDVFWMDDTAEE